MMQQRYGVRPDTDDRVTVEGFLDVQLSRLTRLLSPLFKLTGALVPYEGRAVPVSVSFYCSPGRRDFHFDRIFHFPQKEYRFHSRMELLPDGSMVEFMRFGIGWHFWYVVEGNKIALKHRGYVWSVRRLLVPLPLQWLLGYAYAEEEPLSDTAFRMNFEIHHPWLGFTYGYGGTFIKIY